MRELNFFKMIAHFKNRISGAKAREKIFNLIIRGEKLAKKL